MAEAQEPAVQPEVSQFIARLTLSELQQWEYEIQVQNMAANLPAVSLRYVLHGDGTDSIPHITLGCVAIWEIEPAQARQSTAALWAMIHPEDQNSVRTLMGRSAKTGQPWFCEWRITTPSGQQKWLQGLGRPDPLTTGDMAWDTLIWDISDRKFADLALTETTQQLHSFIDNIPALVTVLDETGRYIKANQATADQFDLRAEELVGQTLADLMPTPAVATWMARLRHVLSTQTAMVVEDRLSLPAGETVFNTILFPLGSANYTRRAIGIVATDVTPLMEAQMISRRQAQEERLIRTMTQHIRGSLNLEDILQTTVTEVRQFLQTDRVIIYRFNADQSGTILVEAQPPPWLSALGLTLEDTCFTTRPEMIEQYRQGRISQIEDLDQAALDPCYRDLLTRLQVRANLVLPIVYDERLWGLLCVHHCRSPRRWQPEEVSLLKQLTDQVAIALHQSQLLTQAALQTQQEKLLNAIVTAISDSLELEEVLQQAATAILKTFQASRSNVILCQETDQELVHTTAAAVPGIDDLRGQRVPIAGNPHAQWILSQAEPVAIDDVTTEPTLAPQLALAQQLHIGAILAVSIRYRDTVKGILSVHQCHGPRPWSDDEKRLMKRVADHLAIAIQQAELYQQARAELAERQRLEAQLRHEVGHDRLTGLPNRTLFLERLSAALEQLHQYCDEPHQPCQPAPDTASLMGNRHQFAVLFLDLDRFKVVNDSLGHTMGDQLLKMVALRLESCLGDGDIAARLGGDEFVVLLADLDHTNTAIAMARRIHAALEAPIVLDGYEVFVRASIGITLSSQLYTDPNQVLRDADIAMYQAKASDRDYALFDIPMYTLAMQQMQIENDLRHALERQEFRIHYQPIFELATGQIQGFEALVRWQHPERGLLLPLEFIPIAENTGLITALDLWVLNQACGQLHQWRQQFPAYPDLTINVNLSGKQFVRPDLIQQIDRALTSNHLSGQYLKVEITESVLIQNAQLAIDQLRQLRQRQIQICMDDFGTGYSSLSYLHRFPVDVLKIDKSFISGFPQAEASQGDSVIVKAILSLAASLNLMVVAEGIETAEQWQYLQENHCLWGQGFHFARPMAADQVAILLAEQSPRPDGKIPRILSAAWPLNTARGSHPRF
ncbi:MAG: EAL domain-containing protein [Nodosilinea sp.]